MEGEAKTRVVTLKKTRVLNNEVEAMSRVWGRGKAEAFTQSLCLQQHTFCCSRGAIQTKKKPLKVKNEGQHNFELDNEGWKKIPCWFLDL